MKSVDPYFKKKYHETEYNCLHFSAEVWYDLTGQDIKEILAGFLEDVSTLKRKARSIWIEIPKPIEPCLVVMQRPKINPHLGVYLRGRVLHITSAAVEFQPVRVASRGFLTTRFLQCRL